MIVSEKKLRAAVEAAGGFVNAHAHLDRANTLPDAAMTSGEMPLKAKWSYVDGVKRASSEADYKARILAGIAMLRSMGTTATMSFIDVDDAAGDRALRAAAAIRADLGAEFPLKLANQGYAGFVTREGRAWLDRAAEVVDIIGGMPEKDAPHNGKHLDAVLSVAKRQGKLLHVHVDQLDTPGETETELVAKKTIEHGMEGRVWTVHSVSLAAHSLAYRRTVYRLMKDAGVGVIACPTAYIDERRSEDLMPRHTPIVPIEELLEQDIPVALGTDNICDTYKPLANGDMWLELRFAIELCRLYAVPEETLVAMATTNGRRALGLPPEPMAVEVREIAHAR